MCSLYGLVVSKKLVTLDDIFKTLELSVVFYRFGELSMLENQFSLLLKLMHIFYRYYIYVKKNSCKMH
jgi:hypothetical protein